MEREVLELDIALINLYNPDNAYIDLLSMADIYPRTDIDNIYSETNIQFDLEYLKSLYKKTYKDNIDCRKEIKEFYLKYFNYNLVPYV